LPSGENRECGTAAQAHDLSRSFFAKGWPQYELDGIVTRSVAGEQTLLPVWHEITKAEVMAQSLSLADKIARSTAQFTIEEIADEIADVVSPESDSAVRQHHWTVSSNPRKYRSSSLEDGSSESVANEGRTSSRSGDHRLVMASGLCGLVRATCSRSGVLTG
jgi:hypothetical protein